jgi:hypothetical protein
MAILGIRKKLENQGSLLTAFDGATPPPVALIDPTVSVNSTQLSNYRGVTPPKYIDNAPTD